MSIVPRSSHIRCKSCRRQLPLDHFVLLPKTEWAKFPRYSDICIPCDRAEYQRKIEQAQRDFLESKSKRDGFLYVIRCQQFHKIGVTRTGQRNWSTDNPFEIEVLLMLKTSNMRALEKHLHRRLKAYLHRGEWFKLPSDIVDRLISASSDQDIIQI